MKVETRRLVENARERYEDALTSEAIRRFLGKVADVPDFAWGTFDWSRRWASDWTGAAEARCDEAATARDVQERTGTSLFQVAASYEDTDVTAAYDIDVASDSGVLRAFMPGSGEVTARPGGAVPPPAYPKDGYQGRLPSEDPNNPSDIGSRLHYLELDHRWNTPTISKPGTVTDMDRCWQALGNTPGRGAMARFLNEHYQVIKDAENFLRVHSMPPDDPPSDMFDEALDAVPGIIENRAELIAVAKNGYQEMAEDMESDTTSLTLVWSDSDGAAAYEIHANNCAKYYRTIAAEASWFHKEGKKAAKTLDNLMVAYANVGYEKINGIIDTLEAAKDAASDLTDSLDDPLKALAKAVTGLADVMLQSWRAANNEARATLEISKAAAKGPQLGAVDHSAEPFPGEGGVKNNRWKEPGAW
ncbi:MAG: hypothetical protein ACRDTU_16795 [Micromonosporaceae bacterium]